MRLKFERTVAAGAVIYQAGVTYEVKDQHAAEVYCAHGTAKRVDGLATTETLMRQHPASVPPEPVTAPAKPKTEAKG